MKEGGYLGDSSYYTCVKNLDLTLWQESGEKGINLTDATKKLTVFAD